MHIVSAPPSTRPFSDTNFRSTRSRSSSANSVTKSTAASFSPDRAVRDLRIRMSNTVLAAPISPGCDTRMEPATKSVNYPNLHGAQPQPQASDNEYVKEEYHDNNNGASTDGDRLGAQRGRLGHQDRFDRPQGIDHSRPNFERQSSFSKRHSSFNTRREMPYPHGHFGSASTSSRPFPSKDTQDQSSQHNHTIPPLSPASSRTLESSTRASSSDPCQNQQSSSPQTPDFECASSHSLPMPDSVPYSALPTINLLSQLEHTPPKYTSPRPAPPPPTFSSRSSSEFISPLPTSSYATLPSRQSPSPPLLVADEDIDLSPLLTYPYRFSDPAPPRVTPHQPTVSSRPTSLPQVLPGNSARSALHGACLDLPPPQPPTILTPSLPLSGGANRKPAPHEPFLARRLPSADHTYIAVETFNTEYILVVRLPGFQRDAITLAARRRRVLHVVADDWNEDGGHFERRITFGYDADLYNVKAEFDGEFLKIHVPRKFLIIGHGRTIRSIPIPAPTQ